MRLAPRRQRAAGAKHWPTDRKVMLHVGCGPRSYALPPEFSDWHEVRLDINPDVNPDIVADIVDMPEIESMSVDGVWSSHNLEHVFGYQVALTLGEFYRVLRPGGVAHVQVPDVLVPARAVARGNLETVLNTSSAGPVTALDMLFGYGPAIASGEHFMAHRTAFTKQTLTRKFIHARFADVRVVARDDALWATARRPEAD
jgi:SAM-dependent methyltransferase